MRQPHRHQCQYKMNRIAKMPAGVILQTTQAAAEIRKIEFKTELELPTNQLIGDLVELAGSPYFHSMLDMELRAIMDKHDMGHPDFTRDRRLMLNHLRVAAMHLHDQMYFAGLLSHMELPYQILSRNRHAVFLVRSDVWRERMLRDVDDALL